MSTIVERIINSVRGKHECYTIRRSRLGRESASIDIDRSTKRGGGELELESELALIFQTSIEIHLLTCGPRHHGGDLLGSGRIPLRASRAARRGQELPGGQRPRGHEHRQLEIDPPNLHTVQHIDECG